MAYFGNESMVYIKNQKNDGGGVTDFSAYTTYVDPIASNNRLILNSGIINENVSLIERQHITGDRQNVDEDVFRDRSSFSGSISTPLTDATHASNLAFRGLLESAFGNVEMYTANSRHYFTLSASNTPIKNSATAASHANSFAGLSMAIALPGANSIENLRKVTGALVQSMSYSSNASGLSNLDFSIIANKIDYQTTGVTVHNLPTVATVGRASGYKSSLKIGDKISTSNVDSNNSASFASVTLAYSSELPSNLNNKLYITDFSFELNNGVDLIDVLESTSLGNSGVPYYTSPRRVSGSFTVLWNEGAKELATKILGKGLNTSPERFGLVHDVTIPGINKTVTFAFPNVHFDSGGLTDLSPDQLSATFSFVAYQTATTQNDELVIRFM